MALAWTPEQAPRAEAFLGNLTLDSGARWGDVMQPWQMPQFRNVLGLPGAETDKKLIEVCGPVGAGKDQMIAGSVLAALHFAEPGVRIIKQSTDLAKSKDVVMCVRGFVRRDVRVGWGIQIVRNEIRNVCPACEKPDCLGSDKCKKRGPGSRGGVVICEALDGPSHSGAIFDLAICNEVQEWPAPHGVEVYDQLFARRHKKSARFVVFSNAPKTAKGEWRRDRWEEARREGSDWYYHQIPVESCPWITKEHIEQARRNMATLKFRRWFYCEPSDGEGGLLTKDEIKSAIDHELARATGPDRPGRRYLGLDVGVKRDHYSICILRVTPDKAVVLERMDVFAPRDFAGGEVDLDAAAREVEHYAKAWRAHVFMDPYQSRELGQRLTKTGAKVEIINFTASNLTEMAHAVMDLFRDGRIRIYPDAGRTEVGEGDFTSLSAQLAAAEVKEQERGIRIVHTRTKAGHGDQATAFALAALGAARHGFGAVTVACGSERSEAPERDERGASKWRKTLRGFRDRARTFSRRAS